MSYELKQPYNNKQRADFIVEYNHNQGLRIEETEMFLFALEANEIMGEKEIEIDVPDFEEIEVPIYDENGEEISKEIVKQPVMEEIEEEIEVPVYDEETGEFLNYETQIVKRKVQKTHKERIVVPYPVIDPDYEEKQKQKERERINMLSLTKREVFLALYKAKGITPEMVKSQITDSEAMIEFEYANTYYRGNPLINLIGEKLGYTSDELDYLFINGELPEREEPEPTETEEEEDNENTKLN